MSCASRVTLRTCVVCERATPSLRRTSVRSRTAQIHRDPPVHVPVTTASPFTMHHPPAARRGRRALRGHDRGRVDSVCGREAKGVQLQAGGHEARPRRRRDAPGTRSAPLLESARARQLRARGSACSLRPCVAAFVRQLERDLASIGICLHALDEARELEAPDDLVHGLGRDEAEARQRRVGRSWIRRKATMVMYCGGEMLVLRSAPCMEAPKAPTRRSRR